MKKTIGNISLLGGVILAALAAGESQRVSIMRTVDSGLVNKTLHTSVTSHFEDENPDHRFYFDRTLAAGKILDSEDIAWLKSAGQAEVLVLRRAKNQETLPVGAAVLGRVLAEAVLLPEEMEDIQPGRMVGDVFLERLRTLGLDQLKIAAEHAVTKKHDLIQWPLGEEAETPEHYQLAGSKLAQTVSMPIRLKPASYVDDALLARLEASGVTELAVKIPKEWALESWQDRWRFLVGVLLVLAGVLLKRSKPSAESVQAEEQEVALVAEALVELEGQVERLVLNCKELTPHELQSKIDPLLNGPVYRIAEGRYTIRSSHGGKVFAAVMDAFARGERKLNRAWSAAVDMHAEESRASLTASLPSLREAREALPGTQPPTPIGFDSADSDTPLPPDVPAVGAGHWADEDL